MQQSIPPPPGPPPSPLKGIERLADELKSEKTKLNASLQDRAKLKTDIDSLKQVIEQYKAKVNELTLSINEGQQTNQLLETTIDELHHDKDSLTNQLTDSKNDYQQLLSQYHTLIGQQQTLQEENLSYQEENKLLLLKTESFEKKLLTKDELINNLQQELIELRNNQLLIEQEKIQTSQQLHQETNKNEELLTQLTIQTALEDGYELTKVSNDELKHELDRALQLNHELNQEIAKITNDLMASQQSTYDYKASHMKLTFEHERLTKEHQELSSMYSLLQEQLQSEQLAKDSAFDRLDIQHKSRQYMDHQLQELKENQQQFNEVNQQLSQENFLLKKTIEELQHGSTTNQSIDMNKQQLLQEQLTEQTQLITNMTQEMDLLKNQLIEMRKKVLKKELEDTSGLVSSKILLDREQVGRQVYEGIISDLRREIDTLNNQYHELLQRYNERNSKASLAEQLQEEVNMYKELAQSVSLESQTLAISASETADRSIKYTQERQSLLTDIHRKEIELQTQQQQITLLQEEIQSFKEKIKFFHQTKVTSEKKSTELLTTKTKLEAGIEELRQQFDQQTIQLTKYQHLYTTLQHEYELIKQQTMNQTTLDQENIQSQQRIDQLTSQLTQTQQTFQYELQLLQQRYDLQTNDIQSFQRHITQLQSQLYEKETLINQLLEQKETLQQANHGLMYEINQYKTFQTEEKLSLLTSEMQATMQDYEMINQEKAKQQDLLEEINQKYKSEVEKNIVLTMEINLLHEKQEHLTQELAVFRSIDLYSSSMQRQLTTYRKENKSSSFSPQNTNNNNYQNNNRSMFPSAFQSSPKSSARPRSQSPSHHNYKPSIPTIPSSSIIVNSLNKSASRGLSMKDIHSTPMTNTINNINNNTSISAIPSSEEDEVESFPQRSRSMDSQLLQEQKAKEEEEERKAMTYVPENEEDREERIRKLQIERQKRREKREKQLMQQILAHEEIRQEVEEDQGFGVSVRRSTSLTQPKRSTSPLLPVHSTPRLASSGYSSSFPMNASNRYESSSTRQTLSTNRAPESPFFRTPLQPHQPRSQSTYSSFDLNSSKPSNTNNNYTNNKDNNFSKTNNKQPGNIKSFSELMEKARRQLTM